jgi:two-component system cell cycle response regulator
VTTGTEAGEQTLLVEKLFGNEGLPPGVVPVDEHVMFLRLASEACRGLVGSAKDLTIAVDEHTAKNCAALLDAAGEIEHIYVFGHRPPQAQDRTNFTEVLVPPILGPKDHVLLVAGRDFHLVLIGTAGVSDSERDTVFHGIWSVQPDIVARIARSLFVGAQGPKVETSSDDAAMLTQCALKLMRAHAEELAERQRNTAMDKADLFAVLNILKAISSRRRAHDVLYVFVQQIARVIRAERCSVVRVWGSSNQACVLASHEDANVADRNIDLGKYPELRYALNSHEKIVINDVQTHPLMRPVLDGLKSAGIGAVLVIPVVLFDEQVGSLFLRAARKTGSFSIREISFFEIVASAASNALERAQLFETIQSANERLEQLAITDGLTGLYNQRHFREKFSEEYARCARYQVPLACVIFDVDFFKNINDRHGHLAGDQVLRGVAQRALACTRKIDFAARYGGEEFVILMPQTDVAGANIQAERLRECIANQPFDGIQVTVSVGVAVYDKRTMTRPDDLLKAADDAMYKAKANGRNQVVIATTE